MHDLYSLNMNTALEMDMSLAQILDNYQMPKISDFGRAASGVKDNFASAITSMGFK